MRKVFDVNKPLPVIYDEWEGCLDCELGRSRDLLGSQQVFGAGESRGIMFIGSEPTGYDVSAGATIGGKPGQFLLRLLHRFHIDKYFITNLVACRSCTPMLDEAGQPIIGKSYGGKPGLPRYKDQPATRPQLEACSERVYEEIYKTDPILIVTFGQAPAAFLRGNSFNVSRERGIPEIISIPGAGHVAALSPKRKEWIRKVHGKLVSPVVRSQVQYLMVPTLHPRDVRDKINDEHKGNPFELFTTDLRRAKQVYDDYLEKLHNRTPDDLGTYDDTYLIAKELQEEDESEGKSDGD